MVKVDDIVRFLNDVGGGRVVRVEGPIVYVEDEDGFERPAQAREVVVVGQGGTKASAYDARSPSRANSWSLTSLRQR